MAEKWEDVAENTSRLGVEGGYLYRLGDQLAFVPTGIASDLADISESLWTIKTAIEGATSAPYGSEARAIRTCNIGD